MTKNEQSALIILVATAADRKSATGDLRELPEERRSVRAALQQAEQQGLCKVELLADATLQDVFDAFQRYRDRVVIFHFGGHANSYQLLLDSDTAGSRGLAQFLGDQRGLKLVFLNGCSTYGHVHALHQAGISMVVATSRAVRDDVARQFASRFYGQLGAGENVERAFRAAEAEARDEVRGQPGIAKRDFGDASDFDIARQGWPWDLALASGADAERKWSLAEAAADPTFGIPPVPKGRLPEQSEGPYLGLRRFERADAELFFGRGRDVRALYEWLKAGENAAPLLVLHGQSGVGKSSLLDAGFLPRVEQQYKTRPVRRDPKKGLVWTLRTALGAAEDDDLHRIWIAAEDSVGKPLLLVIDQLEEALTQPILGLHTELDDFVAALVAIFHDPSRRPQGKLILGLRKDYYPELEDRLKAAKLPRTSHFLLPLGRAGIIEAITGPTIVERLRRHYNLTIAPPESGEEPVAEAIADDLRRDQNSPIAPTLALLLAKMWTVVPVGPQGERQFTRTLYQELARPGEGGLLDKFVAEALGELARWRRDLAQAGLFLDILEYHTTALGTARARDWSELRRDYAHHEAILPELLDRSRSGRLLSEEGQAASAGRMTRLAHDTLAPLVRRHYELSDAPGQRARRILERRASGWVPSETATLLTATSPSRERPAPAIDRPLDETDLRSVEQGQQGMRLPTAAEQQLLAVSRKANLIRKHIRMHPDPLVRALLVPALEAFPAMEDRAHLARLAADRPIPLSVLRGHRVLAFCPRGERVVTASVDHIARVWRADGTGDPVLLSGHTSDITSAAFSHDGSRIVTASADATARVWRTDGWGGPVILRGHQAGVFAAAFSSDGSRVVTTSADGTARVWRADGAGDPVVLGGVTETVRSAAFSPSGELVATICLHGKTLIWRADGIGDPLELGGSAAYKSAFSPDGTRVLTVCYEYKSEVCRVDGTDKPIVLVGHTGKVRDAAFSPNGNTVVTVSEDGTVRVCPADGTGKSIVLGAHGGPVVGVAFSPDGTRVVSASEDGTAAVWTTDGIGEAVWLRHEEEVSGAAFTVDGERIVTVSRKDLLRVWLADGRGDPTVLRGHNDLVYTAAFSPDGALIVTASADGTARLWRIDGTGTSVVLSGDEVGPPDHRRPDLRGRVEMHSALFNFDGTRVLTISEDKVRVWQVDGTNPPALLPHNDWVLRAAFTRDGTHVLTVCVDGTIRMWRVDGTDERLLLKGDRGARLRVAAISDDSSRVFIASELGKRQIVHVDGTTSVVSLHSELSHQMAEFTTDGTCVVTILVNTARIWRADGTGEPVVLQGHTDEITSARFSADAAYVVTASRDRTARIWRADGAGEPIVLRGHIEPIASAAFSPDGTEVVTASLDGTARVWRADGTGEPLELRGRGREAGCQFLSAAFSPDGSRVVTTHWDRPAQVWRVNWDSLLTYLQSSTTACLSLSQRRELLEESPAEAQLRYIECERRYGRTPQTLGVTDEQDTQSVQGGQYGTKQRNDSQLGTKR